MSVGLYCTTRVNCYVFVRLDICGVQLWLLKGLEILYELW